MISGTRFLAIGTLTLMAFGQAGLAADVRLFVRHDVADFGEWKRRYDSYADWQEKMGGDARRSTGRPRMPMT